jgi:hypothetical protein
MQNDYASYVEDMNNMPAPTNDEIDQMLEDMWREQCDRLEREWELEVEYKLLTGQR